MGKSQKKCNVEGCNDKANTNTKGMCTKHYHRVYRYGNPHIVHSTGAKYYIKKTKKIKFDVDEKGCFICTSHHFDKDGYPRIMTRKKYYVMSRLIYEECFGEISEGHVIRHKCDNPSCINPEHLEAGTHLDNSIDKVMRNRSFKPKGTKNANAKLDDNKVREIRKLLEDGHTQQSIADQYNVSRRTIGQIKNKQKWRHVI